MQVEYSRTWKCREDSNHVHEITRSSDKQLEDLNPGMWILHKWEMEKIFWKDLTVYKDKIGVVFEVLSVADGIMCERHSRTKGQQLPQ